MALKRTIDEEAFKALPKDVQKEYTKSGDEYVLDVEGFEDATELKRAKDNEVKEHAKTKAKLDKAEKKAKELEDGANADVAKVRTDLETKHAKELGDRDTAINGLRSTLIKQAVERVTGEIAGRISKAPAIMSRYLRDFITAEVGDDNSVTVRVLGADGKPNGKTVEQLEKDVVADKQFADILVASKANGGGGAPRSPGPGGGAPNPPTPDQSKPTDLAALKPTDMAARITARKEAAKQT